MSDNTYLPAFDPTDEPRPCSHPRDALTMDAHGQAYCRACGAREDDQQQRAMSG